MTPAIPPQLPDQELLKQLPNEELVAIILEQQRVLEQLMQTVNRLQVTLHQDSQTSSKPPSTDLLKKPEKNQTLQQPETAKEEPLRKPGGQPGHEGKTRNGFKRIDRYQILRPQECPDCGGHKFVAEPVRVQVQQVAQLVEHPIEVVEYQQHSCECVDCGQIHTAFWPESIVPGQDLGVSLQALMVWLGNYGHLSYEKQQELLCELSDINIGVGTLQATNARMATSVKGSVEALREWVKQQPQVHVDESPWPVLGRSVCGGRFPRKTSLRKEWMWVIAGQEFCIFHAGDTRSRAERSRSVRGRV